jgi:hypothetical protein
MLSARATQSGGDPRQARGVRVEHTSALAQYIGALARAGRRFTIRWRCAALSGSISAASRCPTRRLTRPTSAESATRLYRRAFRNPPGGTTLAAPSLQWSGRGSTPSSTCICSAGCWHRRHHTISRTPAAAATPSVSGGPSSDFTCSDRRLSHGSPTFRSGRLTANRRRIFKSMPAR